MHSTFCTRTPTTRQSRGRSGQFTWRMDSGVPRTWMRIGTPLWKAGLYRNSFVFLLERSRHQARLSSAQTQTARTAKLSRSTYSLSFTRPSRETCRTASVSNKIRFLLNRMAGSCDGPFRSSSRGHAKQEIFRLSQCPARIDAKLERGMVPVH